MKKVNEVVRFQICILLSTSEYSHYIQRLYILRINFRFCYMRKTVVFSIKREGLCYVGLHNLKGHYWHSSSKYCQWLNIIYTLGQHQKRDVMNESTDGNKWATQYSRNNDSVKRVQVDKKYIHLGQLARI